jgi:hypothetical protein
MCFRFALKITKLIDLNFCMRFAVEDAKLFDLLVCELHSLVRTEKIHFVESW